MRGIVVLLMFLTSCGYHLGQGGLVSRYTTISVPFAGGDDEGRLTSHLVRALSQSGPLKVVSCDADLTLRVRLLELRNRNIGYRYDQRSCHCLGKALIPTEMRKILSAEVTLLQGENLLLGPVIIVANYDFDFDYCDVQKKVNVFSLGQLVLR